MADVAVSTSLSEANKPIDVSLLPLKALLNLGKIQSFDCRPLSMWYYRANQHTAPSLSYVRQASVDRFQPIALFGAPLSRISGQLCGGRRTKNAGIVAAVCQLYGGTHVQRYSVAASLCGSIWRERSSTALGTSGQEEERDSA